MPRSRPWRVTHPHVPGPDLDARDRGQDRRRLPGRNPGQDLQAPEPSWPPTPGSLPSHAARRQVSDASHGQSGQVAYGDAHVLGHRHCQGLDGGGLVDLSSPGFCGGWFIWCRWLPVVIVPGGGGRVPRRLRARRGFACRWRSVAGWCPYQWTHSAVASSAASMSCQGPWPKDELGLVQRVERLGQGEAERESALESTEATASRSDRACP